MLAVVFSVFIASLVIVGISIFVVATNGVAIRTPFTRALLKQLTIAASLSIGFSVPLLALYAFAGADAFNSINWFAVAVTWFILWLVATI